MSAGSDHRHSFDSPYASISHHGIALPLPPLQALSPMLFAPLATPHPRARLAHLMPALSFLAFRRRQRLVERSGGSVDGSCPGPRRVWLSRAFILLTRAARSFPSLLYSYHNRYWSILPHLPLAMASIVSSAMNPTGFQAPLSPPDPSLEAPPDCNDPYVTGIFRDIDSAHLCSLLDATAAYLERWQLSHDCRVVVWNLKAEQDAALARDADQEPARLACPCRRRGEEEVKEPGF